MRRREVRRRLTTRVGSVSENGLFWELAPRHGFEPRFDEPLRVVQVTDSEKARNAELVTKDRHRYNHRYSLAQDKVGSLAMPTASE
jgi:hypothetical protein